MTKEIYLPIDNKNYAIRKAVAINLLLIGLFLLFYIKNQNFDFLELVIIVLFSSIILSFLYIRKQNIRKAVLVNDEIILEYNKKIIAIPVKQIEQITTSLNYFIKFNGNLSLSIRIELNQNYNFGKIIYLEYDKKYKIDIDPEEVRILKEKIKNDG